MRTPVRNVVTYTDLRPGDYVLIEKQKGGTGPAEAVQGTIQRVVAGYGVVLKETQPRRLVSPGVTEGGARFIPKVNQTFVLLERKED